MSGLSLTPAEYQRLSEYIYLKTGIRFAPGKEYYVARKVEKRMQALGLESFSRYFSFIRFSPSAEEMEY